MQYVIDAPRRQTPDETFGQYAAQQLTPEAFELIETANLDWQVQNYLRWLDRSCSREYPFPEKADLVATAISQIATEQHGEAFQAAVDKH